MKTWSSIIRGFQWRCLRVACAIVVTVSIVVHWPFIESTASAFATDWLALMQRSDTTIPAPHTANLQRIKINIRKAVEFSFPDSIVAASVLDPEILTATIQSDQTLLLTGLRVGQTILIVSGHSRRVTYAIDVVRTAAAKVGDHNQPDEHLQPFSGSQGFYFSPGSGSGPSLLRYAFDYRQALGNSRVLRTSGELFRFYGSGDRGFTLPLTSFGANRLILGLDTQATRFDLLDSQLNFSQLSLNGYTLRGPHFLLTSDSRWRGLEFFAGNARPQLAIFSHGGGRLAGITIPILRSERLAMRVGAVWVAPARNDFSLGPAQSAAENDQSDFVWQTDVRYSPAEHTNVSGELAYAKNAVSWRARLDLQHGPFTFSGEALHLDHKSPLIAIGAQAQGRDRATVNFYWRPSPRFNAIATYARSTIVPAEVSARSELNNRTFLISANLHPSRSSHFGFTLNHQLINLPTSPLVPISLNLETQSAVFKWDQRLSSRWTNNLEARVVVSRENSTDVQTNRGVIIREQVRYNWRRGSAAGFVNFRNSTPSLEGLLVRNPSLLPVNFRATFTSDPRGFLLRNRDALPQLLNGVELPLTRNTEAGVNIQASGRRLGFAGEAVYGTGTFAATPQRNLQVSVSGDLKLDAANSLQASISRSLAFTGPGNQAAITIGYVHRFGSGSGGGFQFSRLLGIGRGRIKGRVFMDLNSNGQQDSDEHGLAGIKVQLDGLRAAITDAHGEFKFEALEPGDFEIALFSSELGVNLRATRAMVDHVSVSPRQTVELTFGLTNTGYIAGRVFNDLFLTGQYDAGDAPGLKGVSLKLYAADGTYSPRENAKSISQTADSNGYYEFRNLPPGKYVLQVDPDTLPANFDVPLKMSWPLTVAPLQPFYFDLPFAAQRAISGVVYIDRDNDGNFDPRKDSVVEGARIVCGRAEAVSTRNGLYLLRDLPAGKLNVQVYSPDGTPVAGIRVALAPEATTRSGVNLRIAGIR